MAENDIRQVFLGRVRTDWLDDDRNMVVLQDFGFCDSEGRIWRCYRGDVIDGASIPRFAWVTTGPPYTGKYRLATALHDSAYIHKQHSRFEADKMMLEAMELRGVSLIKRHKMYIAVRLFGRQVWKKDSSLDRLEIDDEAQYSVSPGRKE